MVRRYGFTLAEVLITLGIIGVVAAMSIPTLMTKTGTAEYRSGFKKAVAVLNQAVTMSVALDGTDFSNLNSGNGAGSVLQMFSSRLNVMSTDTVTNATMGFGTSNYTIYLTDGMVVSYPTTAASCTTPGQAGCVAVVDVNGPRKPNRISTATSGNTNAVYDQFTVDFFNNEAMPHDAPAQYILYN